MARRCAHAGGFIELAQGRGHLTQRARAAQREELNASSGLRVVEVTGWWERREHMVNGVAGFDGWRHSLRMTVLIGVAVFAAIAYVVLWPILLVVVSHRRPWPAQVRLLLAAQSSQMASGIVAVSMMEATVVHVSVGGHWVVVSSLARARERLWLSETAGPRSVRLLRYWRAEAIPVLLMQARPAVVEVHGPSGVVTTYASQTARG
jgi:hypothetical protein